MVRTTHAGPRQGTRPVLLSPALPTSWAKAPARNCTPRTGPAPFAHALRPVRSWRPPGPAAQEHGAGLLARNYLPPVPLLLEHYRATGTGRKVRRRWNTNCAPWPPPSAPCPGCGRNGRPEALTHGPFSHANWSRPQRRALLELVRRGRTRLRRAYDRYQGWLMSYFHRMLWNIRERAQTRAGALHQAGAAAGELRPLSGPFSTWLFSGEQPVQERVPPEEVRKRAEPELRYNGQGACRRPRGRRRDRRLSASGWTPPGRILTTRPPS